MGFTRPSDLLRFRLKHGTTDVSDTLLEMIDEMGPIQITQFVLRCATDKVTSINTASKHLRTLQHNGMIESFSDDIDQRVRIVRITAKGRAYLKDWYDGVVEEQGAEQ